jgi:hypothetical protein
MCNCTTLIERGYQMDTALITATVSLITALSGIIFTIVRIRKERDDRRQEFQSKVAEIEAKFLHERVAQRYKTYPEVFKVLGAVRDVPDPAKEHYKSLLQNRRQLQETADSILKHLYGDAGLVMGMPTRNALLSVWRACYLFQTNKVTLRQLVGYFFIARRWLRVDLQIVDIQEVMSELDEIRKRYHLYTSDKKMEKIEETWGEGLT